MITSHHKPTEGRCGKIRYWGKASAKKALRAQQRWDTRVVRIYFCKECKAWHLTSSKKKRTPAFN